MDQTQPKPHSQLFTVRLWSEDIGQGQIEWRGEVRHVLSGETTYFRDWSMLAAQLQQLYKLQRSGLMSNQTNKTFMQNYFAALSGKDKPESVVNQYVDDAELKHHIELFEAAFPKYDLIAEDLVAEDDKVAVRATFRGTQTGEFYGIPATGKAVSVSLMLIYRIANGKIVEHWMNADQLSLMQQLEAIPA